MSDPKSVIISELSSAVASTVGRSAPAVMRKAGASASLALWPELPEGLQWQEAAEIMGKGVADLEGFGDFSVVGEKDGVLSIEFRDCYFGRMADEAGLKAGEQGICHFGFGLVEETLRRLTGLRTKVELVRRDDGTHTCFETATVR